MDGRIRFLALRNNPADPAHGGDFFYVVTGNVDGKDGPLESILREIDEETGIKRVLHLALLPLIRKFTDNWGRRCEETFFGIVTDEDVKYLSAEHIERRWLMRDEFIETIRWYGPREELEGLLDRIEKLVDQ